MLSAGDLPKSKSKPKATTETPLGVWHFSIYEVAFGNTWQPTLKESLNPYPTTLAHGTARGKLAPVVHLSVNVRVQDSSVLACRNDGFALDP